MDGFVIERESLKKGRDAEEFEERDVMGFKEKGAGGLKEKPEVCRNPSLPTQCHSDSIGEGKRTKGRWT